MSTRRSARIRAASASASKNVANVPQDENNNAQMSKRKPKATLPTGKRSAQKEYSQQKQSQPLQDVTNEVPNTRSRRLRGTVAKQHLDKNDEIIAVRPRKKPRQGREPPQVSVSSQEVSPSDLHTEKTHCDREPEKPANKDGEVVVTPPRMRTRQSRQASRHLKRPFHELPSAVPTETALFNSGVAESSSDEIRQDPPRQSPRITVSAPESPSDKVRPNANIQCHRGPVVLTQPSDGTQPEPVQIATPSVVATEQLRSGRLSRAISDSPPASPLSTKQQTKTHRTPWSDENRNTNNAAFDVKRPRQAVHTYGKQRRTARVSLPTMQALGVRAKSPSTGSQGSGEKEEEGDASEEYQESDDESEDTPKRDPKLEAFLEEQKRLWQEVDETDLLVESD